MEYEDFSIRILPTGREDLQVLVDSPAGAGRGTFRPPHLAKDLGSLLLSMGRAVRDTSGGWDRIFDSAALPVSPQQVGEALFKALFVEQVRDLFFESLGISKTLRRGLRIRLHLDPAYPELIPICCLPWEFLLLNGRFLSLDRLTPIVRYLEVDRPSVPLLLSRTLRILLVSANSADLNVKEEERRIESKWGHQIGVTTVRVEAKKDELLKALREEPAHIVHFMGHGKFDHQTGEGFLVLGAELLPGSLLADLMRLPHPPALVVLNACETGVSAPDGALDPFAGVATALVKEGLLAVVAMQYLISDDAAITFSETLYEQLAKGAPIDTAMTEARLTVLNTHSKSAEWGTPVLFMRTPTGKLFDVSVVPIEEKEEVKRFAENLSESEKSTVLRKFERWTDPDEVLADARTRMMNLIDHIARRSEADWVGLTECLLAACSPFSLSCDGPLAGWVSRPENAWQEEGGHLRGLGADPSVFSEPPELSRASLVTWEGLRFRNGYVKARVFAPSLSEGRGVGFVIRHVRDRTALLAVLRGAGQDELSLELWQRQGTRLRLLQSAEVPAARNQKDDYDFSVEVRGQRFVTSVGDISVETHVTLEVVAGYFGLVKFRAPVVRFRDLWVELPEWCNSEKEGLS